jgi:phospholipase A1
VEGLNFGYTQRLFWDLGRKSSPFHNVDYMPEFFYLFPARPVGDVLTLGGQIGIRHESNGRDGAASRTINTLYVQPIATMPIGSYKLTVGPRLWTYLGSLSDNPDAKRFRGNTGLMAEIGSDDGMRLSTTTRLNPGSGKGSFNAELSYPLDRLTHSDLNFYLFGQAFTGFGENLLDYDRRQTRFRIGVGMVR